MLEESRKRLIYAARALSLLRVGLVAAAIFFEIRVDGFNNLLATRALEGSGVTPQALEIKTDTPENAFEAMEGYGKIPQFLINHGAQVDTRTRTSEPRSSEPQAKDRTRWFDC